MGTKVCRTCKEEKDIDDFTICSKNKDGRLTECRDCYKERCNKWKEDNPEKYKGYQIKYRKNNTEKCNQATKDSKVKYPGHDRNWYLNFRYGISIEDYEQLLKHQNYSCAICKRHYTEFKKKLSVDHDHENDIIRGLLCDRCNTAIGLFQDNVENLETAIVYISNYGTGHSIRPEDVDNWFKYEDFDDYLNNRT